MTKIGLLSDTHSFLDERIFQYFKDVDEIWHAGDWGSSAVANQLENFKPIRGVYGNIDDFSIRKRFPEKIRFFCEDVEVVMVHIGGYPNRYNASIKSELFKNPPKIFISGHSHILKVQYDKVLDLLHINPGAAGKQGFHSVQTIIRFEIDKAVIQNLEVIELQNPVEA
jgi:putative phosphoesterase